MADAGDRHDRKQNVVSGENHRCNDDLASGGGLERQQSGDQIDETDPLQHAGNPDLGEPLQGEEWKGR
jgi:hypothetical protein